MNQRLNVLLCIQILICCLPASAQKNAASIFRLVTYNARGEQLAQSHGFFITASGEAVAPWKPFVGASRAIVIDAKGRETEVQTLKGADEIYNLCRFTTQMRVQPLEMASSASSKGETVQVIAAGGKVKTMQIAQVEPFKSYAYYTLSEAAPELDGCPVLNSSGKVIGMYASSGKGVATDVRFTNDFALNGLTINNSVLRTSFLRTSLPTALNDAALTLLLAAQQGDSLKYTAYIDDFLQLFPHEAEGYSRKAALEVDADKMEMAERTMQTALKQVENKAEAHYNYAKLIYQKALYKPEPPFAGWTLDNAASEAQIADEIRPNPLYRHLLAQINYARKQYDTAYRQLMRLASDTAFRSGSLYYEAAQCRIQQHASNDTVLALLDSAVYYSKNTAEEAPYLLARAQKYHEMEAYRKALQDYNRYDTLMLGRAGDSFYYMRYACELSLKLYQLALNDIAHAIVINRNVPGYYAEMAQLQVQVRMLKEALQTADLGLARFPHYGDLYLVKALALIHQDKKAEGLQLLEEAKQYDVAEKAEQLIERYR